MAHNQALLVFVFVKGPAVMLLGQHDDVAEWDGGTRGEEQCLDEINGHRPQGAETSRLRSWIHGSSAQPVSTAFLFPYVFFVMFL